MTGPISDLECAPNCLTCWVQNDPTKCMSCDVGYVLMPVGDLNYQCLTSCDASRGYSADTQDRVCKRTMRPYDNPCTPGFFNQYEGQTNVAACAECQPGKFCESYGASSIASDCDAGYYCKSKSILRSPLDSIVQAIMVGYPTGGVGDICPEGSYCTSGVSAPTSCTGGLYCPDQFMKTLVSSYICKQGYYCSGGSVTSTPNGIWRTQNPSLPLNPGGDQCPKGKFCPQQSSAPSVCTTGNYLPYIGGYSDKECIQCTQGEYCGSAALGATNGQCLAGYFCPAGSSSSTAERCIQDYYCPAGTYSMIPCAPGEYTTQTGSSSCATCPDGKYCRGTSTTNDCPNGYYCKGDNLYPCPAGTYMEDGTAGATGSSFCKTCPPGFACRMPSVKAECASGFYCPQGTKVPRPNGNYNYYNYNNSLKKAFAEVGEMCVPGQYCTNGLSAAVQCLEGYYCPNYASSLMIPCPAGYYCPNKGTRDPGHTNFFNICPQGKYCPKATTTPYTCPAGTYSQSTGAQSDADCDPCPHGFYCPSGSIPYVTDPKVYDAQVGQTWAYKCDAGYYCTPSSTGQQQTECSRGFKCPAGTTYQIACPEGYYQESSGKATCDNCPAGYFCNAVDGTVKAICPKGFYCKQNTVHANQYPCPKGYYGETTGLVQSSGGTAVNGCSDCTNGYYCQFEGQSQMSTKILAGFHARGKNNQIIPDPYKCPQLFYCPEGTQMALACPDGKWTAWKMAESENDCITCPRGYWCKFYTMSQDIDFQNWFAANNAPQNTREAFTLTDLGNHIPAILSKYYGTCDSGYICLEGATQKDPLSPSNGGGYPCPKGFYCPPSAVVEIPCPPGTYQDQEKATTGCKPCTPGYFCPNFQMNFEPSTLGAVDSNLFWCTAGSFCPQGTISPLPCPAGTFNSPAGSSSDNQCLKCTAGKYCDIVGQISESDVCAEGYICAEGAARSAYFNSVSQFQDVSVAGVPTRQTLTHGECPIGQFCKAGDLVGTDCPKATYNEVSGNAACLHCPPGEYCEGGNHHQKCSSGYFCSKRSYVKQPLPEHAAMGGICPADHFCKEGTSQPIICQDGYYQPKVAKSYCDICVPGYTCKAGVKDKCPEYKVCDSTEAAEYPYGRQCPGGFYLEPRQIGLRSHKQCLPCPSGLFCQASRIVEECAPGYVCITEADQHTPNIDNKAYPCPYGYYCLEGTQTPVRCPVGTFTKDLGAKQISECTICQPGYYCNHDDVKPFECPQGHYCPIGSQFPFKCPKGTYGPLKKQSGVDDCKPCEGGYYCNQLGLGNILGKQEYKCPLGHFCPTGTSVKPYACLAGTFTDENAVDKQGGAFLADTLEDCNFCPEHFYCEKGTFYRFRFPCKDGYVCPKGAGGMIACPAGYYCKFDEAQKKVVKTLCPEGNFCRMGSSDPILCEPDQFCPAGSASPSSGGKGAEWCKPGEYHNVNKCDPCLPGFVCDGQTNQKYPFEMKKDRGAECPPGYYCEGSSITFGFSGIDKTPWTKEYEPLMAKKCPAGTYRRNPKAKSLRDCLKCPLGSISPTEASIECYTCGAGSTANANRTSCECIGQFRSWQPSANTCVCQPGYDEPVAVEGQIASTLELDCLPRMAPVCSPAFNFINEFNECVSKDWCKTYYKCPENGEFDETLNGCFCNNVVSDPSQYCDSVCESNAMKAYFTRNGKILLEADGQSKEVDPREFGKALDTSGLACIKDKCPLDSITSNEGAMAASKEASPLFVNYWKNELKLPYNSPYTGGRLLSEGNSTDARMLQGGSQPMGEAIQCIAPGDSITFGVTKKSFPIYIKNSQYNTNAFFDYGAFIALQTKLTSTGLNIDTFGFTFVEQGVYVFGDYSAPEKFQTIALVTEDQDRCEGQKQWPITIENMQRLGIAPNTPKLRSYDGWLYAIPPFFIMISFMVIVWGMIIEARIEKREAELREQREGSVNLIKYFKKAQDKFDKLEYLADLYKLIKENLHEINLQIAENQRRTEEENRDNMDKMLKDKHSLLRELRKGKGDINLEDIRSGLLQMLSNLRFEDGRSLEEVYKQQMTQLKIVEEQKRLEEIQQHSASDSEASSIQRDSDASVAVSHHSSKKSGKDSESEKDDDLQEFTADPTLYDDLLKARSQFKTKREHFELQLDMSLPQEDRDSIMSRYDDQMQKLEKELLKDQEEQSNALKAKVAERQKQAKSVLDGANEKLAHTYGLIADLKKQIEDNELEKDDIQVTGINSKGMKKEREIEMRARMQEVDKEKDNRLAQMREDYMQKIKKAPNAIEKEAILEEMGERLKHTEEALEDDKRRQESNLLKLLKARQRKNLKQTIKKIDKETEQLYQELDKLNITVEKAKADVYSKQNVKNQPGLVNDNLSRKIAEIVNQASTDINEKQINFNGTFSQQEKDDLEIERAKLESDKQKELKAIDVQVEEELDSQIKRRVNERQELKFNLQQKVQVCADPDEKNKLLEQLKEVEARVQLEIDDENRNQEAILEERRRRKADRMAIRKMRIEHDQQNDLLSKELSINNKKFKLSISEMTEASNSLMNQAIKDFIHPDYPNKEQALILVAEINDQLLERIMKMLQSKQFFDMAKHLQCLQQQIATDQMIQLKEIHARYDHYDENAKHDFTGQQQVDELTKLQAQRILECQLVNEKVAREIAEKESSLRQKQEQNFFKEKKEIITQQNGIKRAQILAVMQKYPVEKTIQEVGSKIIKRIDLTTDEEIVELEKEKEQRIETAKLRIIAENEEELQLMQDNLNDAMSREEQLMNEQLDQRKNEIMKIKKQNLDDRLRMAAGEMSQQQISELKEQYDKEFENLDAAIRNEKSQQMGKMRTAMLQRRIEKERKRKQDEQEKEEARRREAVNKMNAGMARVFKDYISKKQADQQSEDIMHKNIKIEDLKKKLDKWGRTINKGKNERGDDAWQLTNAQVEENNELDAKAKREQEEKAKINYDTDELFYRILRVERMADRVKDIQGPKDLAKVFQDIQAINQTLQRQGTANSKTSKQ